MERRGFVAPCPPVCAAATEKKDPVVAGIVNDSSSFLLRTHCWESAVAGLVWRIRLRHLAPLCPGAQNPEHSVQHSPGFVPRATAVVRSP